MGVDQGALFAPATTGRVTLWAGDCIDAMDLMEPESVDSVVCDPPYGLEFMGKEWDKFLPSSARIRVANDADVKRGDDQDGLTVRRRNKPEGYVAGMPFQAWCEEWATAAYRVLKPGGHLVAFGGSRTFHRLACAVEDAGFEIRDCLSWNYGSGFPKSMDVSKAIDNAAGATRKISGPNPRAAQQTSKNATVALGDFAGSPDFLTSPSTPEAAEWDGWGTALKPAWEPIILARKPLIGTVASNVLTHGTGALNIDGTRVGMNGEILHTPQSDPTKREGVVGTDLGISRANTEDFQTAQRDSIERTNALGRWPANVIVSHDDQCVLVGRSEETVDGGEAASATGKAVVEFASGYAAGDGFVGRVVESDVYACVARCPVRILDAQSGTSQSRIGPPRASGGKGPLGFGMLATGAEYDDIGGASRFFYCPKTSADERHGGLPEGFTNSHPTVKPVEVMRWLCRLVTPGGGLVLDPFLGSGTTGVAALAEGFDFVGCEKDPAYLPIAAYRILNANPESIDARVVDA